MSLTVGSLFSGIGGLDLGLERAGMEVRWQAEVDPYCSAVLAKHWPHVPNLGDVTAIEWSDVERVDLICGGYPCQPFSLAGARRGAGDARHLWPYFRDALSVLRPRFAVLENVPGHLSLGFGDVQADLVGLGYDTEWDCIPASAVGAPHRRYRIFVVAYAAERGRHERLHARRSGTSRTSRLPAHIGRSGSDAVMADADSAPWGATGRASEAVFGPEALERLRRCGRVLGRQWATEPDVGRVAHGVPRRVDRLRGLGNAVVPQVAEFVGRQLLAAVGMPTAETKP